MQRLQVNWMLAATALLSTASSQQAVCRGREALWIEGEDTRYRISSDWIETRMAGPWYHNSGLDKTLLSPGQPGVSGGEWHSHFTNGGSPLQVTATYRLTINEGGTYSWWIRLNPFRNRNGGANYSYSFDDGSWLDLDVSEAANQQIDLVDPGIDIRFIAWCYAGRFELSSGQHTVRIRLSHRPGDKENHGGIDVMALVNFPWAPVGVAPPETDPKPAESDEWFILMAGPDPFSPDSIIDMSGLLDETAGQHGCLKRHGAGFAFEDGTPVKFWGINAHMAGTVEAQQRQARFYAKHGINMIREHPVESRLGSLLGSPGQRFFDPATLDDFDRWFAILKENGIYMTWSVFYHHVVLTDEGIDPALYGELPDRGAGKDCYGYASFVQEYHDSQWKYLRLLLSHVNPHTGLAYRDEAALAILEMRNEDSVFFHNPLSDDFVHGDRAPNHRLYLQRLWHEWVERRYRSDANLQAAWGSGRRAGDSVQADPVSSPMYMYAAWEMEEDGPRWNKVSERARMGDFIRFLAELQRGQYERFYSRLRDAGFRGVIVSTAWKAGGPAASAANLWTDDAMDAIDRHNYFGGGAGGHGIAAGPVNNDTHMTKPGRGILSSGLFQVEDKPFLMTEWTQKPPNQWKAEIAPLMAFYGMGLQGWDASYHFAGSRSYMGNGWPGMSSYVTETPHYIGQFPALAFAVYKGHFREGAVVSARRLGLDEVFAGTDALEQTYGTVGYDENELLAHGETPVETLAIGRVMLKVADDQTPSHRMDTARWWNRNTRVVGSATGQLTWDADGKTVLVHSDKTQGIVGFAANGDLYDLPGVTVRSIETPFVSLLFTPLDDRPLLESDHILITAMARDKQYGTIYNADGTDLTEAGGPPLLLEPVQAEVTMKGPAVTSVRAVDAYGVPLPTQLERYANTFRIDGRYATYYYEVKRTVGPAEADLDNTGMVDLADLCILAEEWRRTGRLTGDINGDGEVNTLDLRHLTVHWLANDGK